MWVAIYNLVKNSTYSYINGICRKEKRGIRDWKTRDRGCDKRLLGFSEGFQLLCLPQESLGFPARAAYRGAMIWARLGMKQ